MGRKPVLLAGLLVASLLLALYWVLLGGQRTSSPRGTPAPAAETPREVREPEELLPASRPDPEEGRAESGIVHEPPPKAASTPKAPAAASDETTELAGTLTVVDAQGVEHPSESGTLALVLWRGGQSSWREVEVRRGRWNATVPPEESFDALAVESIRVGQRPAQVLEPKGRLPVPDTRWLEVRARWPEESILHVRDQETGAELAPISLVEVEDWPAAQFGHPGAAAERARDAGPSPLRLPVDEEIPADTRTFFARSPGYAWGRIEIDERLGGERFLDLAPAGELEVRFEGSVSDPGTRLRLYASDPAPTFERTLSDANPVTIESLAPGTYRLAVEIGNYWQDPLVVGETRIEIAAGTRTPALVRLEVIEGPERVPLAGVLVLPEEWELGEFALDFTLLDTALGGGDGTFSIASTEMVPPRGGGIRRWSSAGVQPGSYSVELRRLGFSTALRVGPEGERDARIEIPPPGLILVRCLDEATGLEAQGVSVSWHGPVPPEMRGWSNQPAEWDESARRWRIRAPFGTVSLKAWGTAFGHQSRTVEARPETLDITWKLSRLTGLRIVLRDGPTEIPWTQDMSARLEPTEGQAGIRSAQFGDGRYTLLQKEPGGYRLRIGPIVGYEPVPDLDVRLEEGVVVEQVIELQRLR